MVSMPQTSSTHWSFDPTPQVALGAQWQRGRQGSSTPLINFLEHVLDEISVGTHSMDLLAVDSGKFSCFEIELALD